LLSYRSPSVAIESALDVFVKLLVDGVTSLRGTVNTFHVIGSFSSHCRSHSVNREEKMFHRLITVFNLVRY